MTWLDIVTGALRELGVINAVETPSAPDAEFVLGKGRRLLDNWNADRRAVYADTMTSYTIVASTNPHTIGPTGANWTATIRPESIEAANLVISSTSRVPITIRDAQWWMGLVNRAMTTTLPTDLYYEPAWPNGKVHLWGVPTAAYSVELLSRVLLAAISALADTFTLPPGYQDAVTLSLAEDCAPAFQVPVAPELTKNAEKARARIFSANDEPVRLITADAGMPGSQTRGGWDYRIGMYR